MIYKVLEKFRGIFTNLKWWTRQDGDHVSCKISTVQLPKNDSKTKPTSYKHSKNSFSRIYKKRSHVYTRNGRHISGALLLTGCRQNFQGDKECRDLMLRPQYGLFKIALIVFNIS